MAEEGRPTRISYVDANHHGAVVAFEGVRAEVVHPSHQSGMFTSPFAHLELAVGDERLVLRGYFRNDEFMEVERERLA